jgi:hypothetical protein
MARNKIRPNQHKTNTQRGGQGLGETCDYHVVDRLIDLWACFRMGKMVLESATYKYTRRE